MPTVMCPRCQNDTLVLHCSPAVKHCATCGGVLPGSARPTEDRSGAAQTAFQGAVGRIAAERPAPPRV